MKFLRLILCSFAILATGCSGPRVVVLDPQQMELRTDRYIWTVSKASGCISSLDKVEKAWWLPWAEETRERLHSAIPEEYPAPAQSVLNHDQSSLTLTAAAPQLAWKFSRTYTLDDDGTLQVQCNLNNRSDEDLPWNWRLRLPFPLEGGYTQDVPAPRLVRAGESAAWHFSLKPQE
ncbi:MAG: hypothetical protein RL095_816 [Verrucomicrobiota bacterium]|jgi:hypothetical protein